MESSKNIGRALIPYLLRGLTNYVMENKKLTAQDALYYVINSNLYTKLHDEDTKYWYLSTLALYEELEKEKKILKENCGQDILLFTAFCIENYQVLKNKTKEEVIFLFNKFKVFDYLKDVYQPLHTQGGHYIIDEIELFIESQRK